MACLFAEIMKLSTERLKIISTDELSKYFFFLHSTTLKSAINHKSLFRKKIFASTIFLLLNSILQLSLFKKKKRLIKDL